MISDFTFLCHFRQKKSKHETNYGQNTENQEKKNQIILRVLIIYRVKISQLIILPIGFMKLVILYQSLHY